MADPATKPTTNVRIGGLPWKADQEQAQAILAHGGKVISEPEAQEGTAARNDLSYVDENWGSAGKLGMGALSGLTLGIGPGLLASQGLINPGHLGAAQESGLYTAGDMAGTALPAMFTGGESMAARAARMTPAGLMGGLGSASERFAGGFLGDSAGLLGRIGSTPIKMAARGATEGALINMGHTLGDNLLTNKPLSAEAFAASGLDGALFGGLMGGTLGTVGSLGSMAVDSLGNAAKSVAGRGARGLGTIAKSVGIEDFGSDLAVAKTEMGQIGEILHKGGSSIGDSTSGKLSATREYLGVQNAARAEAVTELGRDITGSLETLEKRLPERLAADVIGPVRGTPNEAWASSAVKSFVKSLERAEAPVSAVVVEGIHIPGEKTVTKAKLPGGGVHVTESLSHEINRPGTNLPGYQASEPLTWKKLIQARDQLAEGQGGAFKTELLTAVDSEIRAAMESAGKTPGAEGIAEKYAAATASIKLAKRLEEGLGKKAATALMSSGGSSVTARDIGTFAGMAAIGHPTSGLTWLASKGIGTKLMGRFEPWMAQMAYNNTFGTKAAAATQSLQSKVADSLKSYFGGASKAPSKAAIVHNAEKAEKRTKEPPMDRKNYEALASRAEQLVSNNHQDKVKQYLESMHAAGYAELAEAMMGVNQRAVQYMMWTAPPRQATKGLASLHKTTVSKVPTLEEHRHARQFKGVSGGPLSLLEDLKNGTVSRDQANAVAFVYPEAVGSISMELARVVADMKSRGDSLPMNKITNLAMALNAPLDRTLEGDYVAAVQSSLAAPDPSQAKPPSQQHSGGTIGQAGMALMTPLQTITIGAA